MKNDYWVMMILILLVMITLAIGMYFSVGYKEGIATHTAHVDTALEKWANDPNAPGKTTKLLGTNANGSTSESSDKTDIKFDSNNYDVQYHETPEQLALNDPRIAIDASGKAYTQSDTNPQGNAIYYEPGSYLFGASTYVPNYEDSVYLSKLTGESTVKPIVSPAQIESGFCSFYKDSPMKLEEACQATDVNSCSSTSCCVLLGGSKCVSGDVKGPHRKQNYGDVTIKNPDYYYFQGTCYGNCSGSSLAYAPLGASITNSITNDLSNQILSTWPTGSGTGWWMPGSSGDRTTVTSTRSTNYDGGTNPASSTTGQAGSVDGAIKQQNNSIDLGLFFPPVIVRGPASTQDAISLIYYIGSYYNAVSRLSLSITNANYSTLYTSNSSQLQAFYSASGNIINPLYTFTKVNGNCSTVSPNTVSISNLFNSALDGCKTLEKYPLRFDNPNLERTAEDQSPTGVFSNCPPPNIGSQFVNPFDGMSMVVLFDRFNGGSYYNTFNLDTMKYYLNTGKPIWWNMNINQAYTKIFKQGVNTLKFPQVSDNVIWYNRNTSDDTTYLNNGVSVENCMVIVGYADNVDAAKTADQSSGVFKFINQQGTSFGDKGFGYITYNYFLAVDGKSGNTRFTTADGPTNRVRAFL